MLQKLLISGRSLPDLSFMHVLINLTRKISFRIAVYKALYRFIGGFIPDVVAACDQVFFRLP